MQQRSGALFSNTNLFFYGSPPPAFSGTAFHPGKNRDAGIWRIRHKNYGLAMITRVWPKTGLTHGRLAGNASFSPAFDVPPRHPCRGQSGFWLCTGDSRVGDSAGQNPARPWLGGRLVGKKNLRPLDTRPAENNPIVLKAVRLHGRPHASRSLLLKPLVRAAATRPC